MKTPIFLLRRIAVVLAVICLSWSSVAKAKNLYVAKSGSDSGNACTAQASPCATIAHGIASMAGGDTLNIGDGTYAEQIVQMPKGSASAYTTIQAVHDWGVTIDGSNFANNFIDGIRIGNTSYVAVRGFHIKMSQAADNNVGIGVFTADHVKVQRCSVAYAGTTGNVSAIGVGPAADYTLVEESYVYGGSRYPFLVYQSTHTVMRRNVSRLDYWNGDLQAANMTNYNGDNTVWENNIAIDSDTANIGGSGLFGGFFNENKVPDSSWSGTATRETHRGNIVLNVQAFYSGIYDYDVSNLHTYSDDIIWDSHGGYYGDYIHGDAPMLTASRFTIGKIRGTYSSANGQGSGGTGFFIGPGTGGTKVANTLTNSILWENPFYGVADYAVSDYNSFWMNATANYGGSSATPAAGAHDLTTDLSAGLKYLPRVETGSALATSGSNGGQIGANVIYKWGTAGTLWGEAGYDTITSDLLWPFPNENVISADMASYQGAGAAGVRGFTKGNSLDGSPQTLTKYIWEYLGNQIPPEVYGFHISTGSFPSGVVGKSYQQQATVSGSASGYTWTLSGVLPPGLTLAASSGMISGTPTSAGTSSFTLTVANTATPPVTATGNFQIVITSAGQSNPGGPDGGMGGKGSSASSGCSYVAVAGRGEVMAVASCAMLMGIFWRLRQRRRPSGR